MKTLSKILILIALMLTATSVSAQTAAEVEASVKRMQNPATFSNAAPEAFSKFIAQFSTDSDFFNSRLALPEAEKTENAAILKPELMKAMTPFSKDGEMFYQAFGELQYHKAYLECGYVDSYCTHIYEFSRDKNGRWVLSHIVPGD